MRPGRTDVAPPGRTRSAQQVLAIADGLAKVQKAEREHPGSTREAFLKEPRALAGLLHRRPRRRPHRDRAGARRRPLRRGPRGVDGLPGAMDHGARLPGGVRARGELALGLDPALHPLRRPVHRRAQPVADAATSTCSCFTAFSVSLAFFNDGEGRDLGRRSWCRCSSTSSPACCAIGWSRRDPRERARRPLPLLVPVSWLAIAVVFLLGFRIGLNVTDSNVIDVGYSGVIGADHLTHGEAALRRLPEATTSTATRTGRSTTLAYVPFEAGAAVERALGRPARRARRGARVRPAQRCCCCSSRPAHPRARHWAWCSRTRGRRSRSRSSSLNSNSNDALVVALVLVTCSSRLGPVGARRGRRRSRGLTKFAPLALAPLFATHGARAAAGGRVHRRRSPASRWRVVSLPVLAAGRR